ncbi:MAG: nucleotidyltransferase domain-containing protein [Hydrogenophaga sp.]|uniref:nucleotidyltransferase domain-containing protein n=1 Tax=Hydrogenophaga sp. TaxID=1904254 RepID=UPI0016B8A319|nr:nucleotidyltransferase domain-containing protein [Hydrogenophaga sp.]NIM42430.1 nucleotidyltransferase domain-containing protein [Hydrogenophaga sp.]NIN27581.1 nucleotidyltransferase domain-containing protein [Hydrogenophaga sp.]NIN32401.1 nucleotidyltransferase domain-containing protein [Hydrogenophaga sp.]NIN56852.1 nucleotidyltransferase domain-containing protein [Hydrogenophaga sp.]NIO52997.1 nucleotidyltransferase domain-containing protein [Hydrogenophaga sp.]
MHPLDALLSPAEQRLMSTVLVRPDRDFGTLELLKRMGNSRSAGSTAIKRWVDAGLLRERKVGNQRRLSANPQFLLYPELRRMVLKTRGLTEPLAKALAPVADRLTQAFVFGSVASGNDTSESDIDLALVGDVDLFAVSPLLDDVQAELGRAIHVNLYSAKEWALDDPVLAVIKHGPRLELMEAIHAEAA